MKLYRYDGTSVEIGEGSSRQVDSGVYENNLRNIFIENFKAANSNFTLANCVVSADGLVCSDFATAEYNKGTTIDYCFSISRFKYSEDCVVGLYAGKSIAWVDTANKTFNLSNQWQKDTTLPTPADTEAVTFDFVVGREYSISYIKKAFDVSCVFTDLYTGASVTLSNVTRWQFNGACGVANISGATHFTALCYSAPLPYKAKCLILGDSITEGESMGTGATSADRCAWKLLSNYFHNDCIISGVGGSTSRDAIERFRLFVAMGYTFDYVIMATGTNDGNICMSDAAIPQYTTNITNWVAEIKATGAKVIWGFPPKRSAAYADSQRRIKTGLLAVSPALDFIHFDHATQNTDGEIDNSLFTDGTHPNVTGHQKMFEFAKRALELYGV